MRFHQQQRIKRTAEFEATRGAGVYRHSPYFVINFKLTEAEDTPPLRRLGVIASRRVGPAVDRNFAKRRLREVFRLHQEKLPESCDIVLIAKRGILKSRFEELEKAFLVSVNACQKHWRRRAEEASEGQVNHDGD